MADLVFNSALGAVKQWVENVENNSPVAAVLRLHAWVITATDDDVNNQDTISELQALALSAEATNSGYANLVMDETDITITVDDTNNWVDLILGDQTFTAIVAGDVWSDITYSYDPDGTDTDTTTLLMTLHDFVVTPNGGDITADEGANGFYRAS